MSQKRIVPHRFEGRKPRRTIDRLTNRVIEQPSETPVLCKVALKGTPRAPHFKRWM